MNVVCLNIEKHLVTTATQKLAKSTNSKIHYHICTSLNDLELKLRMPHKRPAMAILAVSSMKEINHLINMGDLLHDIKILLITHDSKKETLNKSHKLYPRFLADRNMDPGKLTEVITKMIESIAKKNPVTGNC